MNQLYQASQNILEQLKELTLQLSDEEYINSLNMLSGNTIGKHVRHIIEFFDVLASGYSKSVVSYDNRAHDPFLEQNRDLVLNKIVELQRWLATKPMDKELILAAGYSENEDTTLKIKSSYFRELSYNIEHAIHHMAIIKMTVITIFPHIKLPSQFGIAYSTIRFDYTQ
ncbi:MAG TPA: hypothetical protein DDY13_18375 [Cytophagales bacterium]|jgi:uncharacterized damage-inducible protein DinB|nr:hypothetical protein [Cytophagales bacterium]